jgi:hypothetical protein
MVHRTHPPPPPPSPEDDIIPPSAARQNIRTPHILYDFIFAIFCLHLTIFTSIFFFSFIFHPLSHFPLFPLPYFNIFFTTNHIHPCE